MSLSNGVPSIPIGEDGSESICWEDEPENKQRCQSQSELNPAVSARPLLKVCGTASVTHLKRTPCFSFSTCKGWWNFYCIRVTFILKYLCKSEGHWKGKKRTHWPFLERNFLVCRLISFLAFVMVSCRANGENSASLSLHSPVKSFSSPLMVRSTNAFALRRWVLNRPLMEVTNPSPAPSFGRLRKVIGYRSGFPDWSLSLKLRSLSGTAVAVGSFWVLALSLNFLPYQINRTAALEQFKRTGFKIPMI